MPAQDNIVVVAERGGGSPVLIELDDIACSWLLSGAGQLSGFLHLFDFRRAGLDSPRDLRGAWLTYEHPTAGRWGGVITSVQRRGQEVELGAMSWAVLLRRRRITPNMLPINAPPGSVFRRVLLDAAREEPTFITVGDTDESGDAVAFDLGGQDVFDGFLSGMGNLGEWTVTQDRVARFAQRIGRDRTASCRLVEAVHLAEPPTWADDLWIMVNDLLVYGADADEDNQGRIRASARVRDATSIQDHGPLEATATFPETRSAGTLLALAKAAITESADPAASLPLTVLDVDDAWSLFREGDEITLELGMPGIEATYRVLARNLNLAQGTMTLAGEARRMVRTFLGAGQ